MEKQKVSQRRISEFTVPRLPAITPSMPSIVPSPRPQVSVSKVVPSLKREAITPSTVSNVISRESVISKQLVSKPQKVNTAPVSEVSPLSPKRMFGDIARNSSIRPSWVPRPPEVNDTILRESDVR